MKQIFKILFQLFVILFISSGYVESEDWIINFGRNVGQIELGEKIEKVECFWGKAKDRMGTLYLYREQGLEFFAPMDRIERIIIIKPSFGSIFYRTSQGITIGSSSEEVINAYGSVQKLLFSKDVYILNYFERGVTFFIKGGKVYKIVIYR